MRVAEWTSGLLVGECLVRLRANPTRGGRARAARPPRVRGSAPGPLRPDALPGVDRGVAAEPGCDARRDCGRREGIADVRVGLRPRKHDAADRAVRKHERTATIAAID